MRTEELVPGRAVFGVLTHQSCWHGRVVSVRGVRVRVVNAAGVVRAVHARYVFPDWPLTGSHPCRPTAAAP